jgi:hypothetical protein
MTKYSMQRNAEYAVKNWKSERGILLVYRCNVSWMINECERLQPDLRRCSWKTEKNNIKHLLRHPITDMYSNQVRLEYKVYFQSLLHK